MIYIIKKKTLKNAISFLNDVLFCVSVSRFLPLNIPILTSYFYLIYFIQMVYILYLSKYNYFYILFFYFVIVIRLTS